MTPLNPATTVKVSDELYMKTIGELNAHPTKYSHQYKACIIHMIDAVSRGYITPAEAYQAWDAQYFPEHLKVRRSAYQHLI